MAADPARSPAPAETTGSDPGLPRSPVPWGAHAGAGRRVLAEGVGTGALVAVVVGSGIAAQRLSPTDVGLQLLENSLATALGLYALILALSGVSRAHLNPWVTALEWLRRRVPGREAAATVLAQVLGGVLGALLANAMFDRPFPEVSSRARTGASLWLSEAVATCGLLVVLHGTGFSRPRAVPAAVAAYVGAAYWFTASTAFANAAVTLGRIFTGSFSGIAPASVPPFLAAQAVGAALAALLLSALRPGWFRAPAPSGETA